MKKLPILPLLGLMAAAVVGFLLGLVVWNDPRPQAPVPKVVAEAEFVLAELKNEIPKVFSDYEVKRTGWTGQSAEGATLNVPGYEFDISSKSLPGILVHPKQVNDELVTPRQSLDDVWGFLYKQFSDAGYKEISSTTYVKGEETCELTHTLERHMLEVRCDSQLVRQALAEQAKPYVDAYVADRNLKVSDIVYGPMIVREDSSGPITASNVIGYQLAEAVVHHNSITSIALYYSHKGAWHYITEASDEFGFSCSDIKKDPHARRAYRHQWCYQRENDEGLQVLDHDVQQQR